MKKLILIFFILLIAGGVGAEDQNLVPRRVRFDAEIPEWVPDHIILAPDLLYAEISALQIILPTDLEIGRIDVISILVDNQIIAFRLDAEGTESLIVQLPLENLGNLDELEIACRDVAAAWVPFLGLVKPEVEEVVVIQERRMTEELARERLLASPFQLVFWSPSYRTFIDTEKEGPSLGFNFWPIILEFQWYFSNNFGITASMYLEYSSYYQLGYDSSELNLFLLPGIGITYRTIGRFSGGFGANIYYGPSRWIAGEDLPDLGITEGEIIWTAMPMIDFYVSLSWNFTNEFSVKMKTGISSMLDVQWLYDNTLPSVMVQLGAGYRW